MAGPKFWRNLKWHPYLDHLKEKLVASQNLVAHSHAHLLRGLNHFLKEENLMALQRGKSNDRRIELKSQEPCFSAIPRNFALIFDKTRNSSAQTW